MTAAAPISEACYQRYLAALLAGDRPNCADLLQDQLAAGVPLKQIYLDLMQRAMYEIGTLWERNLVSVATEHLASATTEVLLALLYPRLFSQAHKDRRALIACVPQEHHQIGARMVADFFELHGWHGFSIGANTPSADLLRSIALHDPDVVGLSMSLLFHRAQLEAMIESVSNAYPALDLLLGGRAFQGDGAGRQAWQELTAAYPRLRYFASLNELEEYLTGD